MRTFVDFAGLHLVELLSQFDHCLGDLIYRTRIGELVMDVVAVAGNHPAEALNI